MTNPPEETLKCFSWWLAALFLAALGGQLWTVWLYGSPIPIWDQWDEAYDVFKPWLEGHLTWGILIAPDNNHRILLTRLLDLGLIQLNGRWDPLLQMTVNAFIHAFYACVLAFCIWVFWGRKNGWIVCFLLMPFFALPYGGENAIWGMDSQWYFMDLCAVLTIAGLGFAKPGSWRWWLGAVASIVGLFAMATGLLASVVAGALILLRAIKHRRIEKKSLAAFCACVVLAGAGSVVVAAPKATGPMRAHSLNEFTSSLSHFLAWPFPDTTIMACFIGLPVAFLLIVYLRPDFQETRLAELLLALALWSLMQSALIAFGRANAAGYIPVASRYMDVCNVFVMASLFAVVLLGGVWERKRFPAWNGLLIPLIFTGIIFFGLCRVSERVVQDVLIVTREWNLISEERLQTYMTTGNKQDLFDAPTIQPDPLRALRLVRDPSLPAILPSACFAPAHAPDPGRLSGIAHWLLKHSVAILSCGLLLFIGLCGCGLARGAPAFKERFPAATVVLLAGLVALGFVWSNRSLQRESVEYDLQQQIVTFFKAINRPDRAAIHERRAEALKAGQIAN